MMIKKIAEINYPKSTKNEELAKRWNKTMHIQSLIRRSSKPSIESVAYSRYKYLDKKNLLT